MDKIIKKNTLIVSIINKTLIVSIFKRKVRVKINLLKRKVILFVDF